MHMYGIENVSYIIYKSITEFSTNDVVQWYHDQYNNLQTNWYKKCLPLIWTAFQKHFDKRWPRAWSPTKST